MTRRRLVHMGSVIRMCKAWIDTIVETNMLCKDWTSSLYSTSMVFQACCEEVGAPICLIYHFHYQAGALVAEYYMRLASIQVQRHILQAFA
jgi:hypothetical protein